MEQMHLTLFLLAAMGCFMIGPVTAMTHIVGGSFGWSIPTNVTFYQEWAKPRTFGVGDKLLFPYRTGRNNVLEVNKKEFDECTQQDVIDMFYSGPTILELNKTGDYYYYSGVGTHCENGQKVAITVTNEEGSAGTPFPLGATSADTPSLGPVPADATNSTSSSASSIGSFGMISGLLPFLLSIII